MHHLTIEEIAALAGVSRGTVSRVLNQHPSVSPVVRTRVQQIIDEHGYVPRAAARTLAGRGSNMVALVIPRRTDLVFADPFYTYTSQGLIEGCARQGYFVTLSMVTGLIEQGFMASLRAGHFAAVVVQAVHIDDLMLPQLLKSGIPLVQIGRHPYLQALSWVDIDGIAAACKIVNHLIQGGHTAIATISGPLYQASALDRRDGYKRALIEAGIAVNPALTMEGDWTYAGGYSAMQRLLAGTARPSAVFAANDLMALGAIRALADAGLSVPRDCAVVGFDDVPVAAYSSPPLTTVHQPLFEFGVAAADMVIARIRSPEQEAQQRILPTTLVVRQSCGVSLGDEARPSRGESRNTTGYSQGRGA